jgi:nicotinate-nucleotide pyrophosphorylase
MKRFILVVLIFCVALYIAACKDNYAVAASGDVTPAVLARYSSAKVNACYKGSIAHSKTVFFVCYSTGKWGKVPFN